MKKSILYITLLFTVIFSFTSCKNDLDVLAPGKESVSVYGIINPNQPIQNIRINKVYLTDGDALVGAQDANTINYSAGELRVTLERYAVGGDVKLPTTFGNNTKREIVLTETVVTTQNGTFSTEQRLWQTADKLLTTGVYKLIIKKNNDGSEIASSKTLMFDSVKSYSQKPFITNATIYPGHGNYNFGTFPNQATNLLNFNNGTQRITVLSTKDAKLYKFVLRFHYINSYTNTAVAKTDYVDMNFNTQSVTKLLGGDKVEITFETAEFLSNLVTEINKKSDADINYRKVNYMQYIVYNGTEELNTFLQVNAPSTTIAQDKASFSNITNGVGIFSSMNKASVTHDLSNTFIDLIACDSKTRGLRFRNSSNIICP